MIDTPGITEECKISELSECHRDAIAQMMKYYDIPPMAYKDLLRVVLLVNDISMPFVDLLKLVETKVEIKAHRQRARQDHEEIMRLSFELSHFQDRTESAILQNLQAIDNTLHQLIERYT